MSAVIPSTILAKELVGVVLAGGRSSRMGEEKSLLELAGQTLLQRSIERLADQVSTLVVSANGDPQRFAPYQLPVIADTICGHKGPLAGILAGMLWAIEHRPAATHIVSIASDTPFYPLELVETLGTALMATGGETQQNRMAIPQTGQRLHPAFGLWPVTLVAALSEYLLGGQCRVLSWLDQQNFVAVRFPLLGKGEKDFDPFFNINTRADLRTAKCWLQTGSAE